MGYVATKEADVTDTAASFHVGLTPERIIDVALELTRTSDLSGWSIRDLARVLDVAPSVIYHHVGREGFHRPSCRRAGARRA